MLREPVLVVGSSVSAIVGLARALSERFCVYAVGSIAGAATTVRDVAPRVVLLRTHHRRQGAARSLVLLRQAVGDGPELLVLTPGTDTHFELAMHKARVYTRLHEPCPPAQLVATVCAASARERGPMGSAHGAAQQAAAARPTMGLRLELR